MPFEPISPVGGFTATPELPRPDDEARPDPTFGETLSSAFRTENTIGSLMASQDLADDHITRDPHFDPWAEIADTPYEPYYEQFARARNPMHFQAIKADIDRENTDRDIISRSGFSGMVAPMAAGVLDWPTLLPGGALVRTAKGGISLLRSSASVAAAGAAGAAVSEAALQGTQQLRTPEESAVVIGGSAILAGALGAGLAKLVSRGELDALAPRVERDFVVPGADQPDVFEPGSLRPSVEAATGASPRAMEVADAIRQAAEEILPAQVRVQVVDTLGAPGDEGLFAIRAFHGTPHDFDRFDMGKIGTGEGAQVFGHGLYFAENEAVAKGYREALSPTLLDGVDVGTRSRERTYGKLKEEGKLDEEIVRQRGLVQKILDDPELTPSRREALAKQIDELDVMERVKRAEVSLGGKLYEVEIKADHEDLLDLDAPLSKQPPRVQEAIRKLGFELVEYRDGHWLQKEIWRHADDYINEHHWGKPGFDVDAETSKRLREAGIPGLRYLDQGSRNAGDGTRNIVIFDDSLVKITKKNGEPVSAAERKEAVDQLFGIRKTDAGPIAEGRFDPQQLLITIAADALDPAKTLRHESIHALKQMGLFTGKQWKTLEAAAKKESWLESNNIKALYEGVYKDRITDDLLLEEAIAEQFSLWRQGKTQAKGALAEIWRQMQLFFERTGNVLRGRGFQTADDVFEAVRGGYVASRAQPPIPSPVAAAAAAGSGRAASVGASAVQRAEDTLKSAFGAEKAFRFQDPMIRLQTSQSPVARRTVQELAETPLTYTKNELGEPTAPLGSEIGAPGSVETRIKFWQGPLAEAMQSVDNAFLMYRKGRAKRFTGEVPALTLKDTLLGTDALTYRDFKGEIAKALRRGDESPIPEVAGAARIIRQRVLDPLKDEAIAAKLLPEDVSVETADSYLNRLYNKERIIAERDQFKAVVSDWLRGQESINVGVRTRLAPMLERHELLEERVSKYERQLERLQQSSAKIEARRQEASGLNRFAFNRAEKLSKPLDETRAEIDTISTKIAAELERIDDLATSIREEKAKFPELQTLERQAVRLAHAAAKVKRDAALIDVVDGADEIEASLSDLNDTLKAVQTFYRKEAQAMRAEDWAKPLVSLEKQRAKLAKEIAPFRKKLTELRNLQRTMEKARKPGARGGAVFESKIRSRVNKLADQESGKKAQIEALQIKLDGAKDELKTVKGTIEGEVTKYQGKSAKEAVTAIAGREKTNLLREEKRQTAITRRDELQKLIAGSGDTPNLPAVASAKQELALLEKQVKPLRPLASADKPVLAAARRIASQLDKEPGEIGDLADQIIDRIIGHPDGRLPYDAHLNRTERGGVAMDARGPLAARQFMIPDAAIERWLENDIETLLRAYTRTMAPDVELTKRFGDVNLQQQMKELEEDYAKRSARATTPAERKKVNAQLDRDKKDLAAIRDRMRGTYNLPSDPNSLMVRAGRVVSSLNYMRMLGGMTLSAIPDVGGVVFAHGLNRVFGDGIIPLFRNWTGARIAMNEVKMAGTALDMVLDSRAMQIADIMDDFGRHTKFERAVSSAARNFGVVSLMAPWNAAMKQFTGLVTMTRMLRAIERAANGKAKPKEIERLAAGGISQANAKKIGEQFAKHGKKGGGVWFANTAEWDEGARSAIEAFRAALVRDVDRIIITPGQDRPLWMSSEIGRLVGQFKSFAISAMQRVVIAGLQQRDMATLSGAAMMTALGGLSGILKAKAAGQPGHTDWSDPKKNAQFLVEAIDRSGLTGWLMDVNSMTEKMTRGAIGLSAITGKPVSRYAARDWVSTFGGPTVGTMNDFRRVVGNTLSGEWNQTDTRVMRRLIPYNNIFYLRQMFDQAEGGINDFLGVPKAAGARR